MMVALIAVALVVDALALLTFHIHRWGQRRLRRSVNQVDVIIVLGAKVLEHGLASNALTARVERAAQLFKQGIAARVLFTGARARGQPSEASVASALALTLGVPHEAHLLEETSRSTWENAREASRVITQRRVAVVTCDFHLMRATSVFVEAGFEVTAVGATRSMTHFDRAWWTFREAIAMVRRPARLRFD